MICPHCNHEIEEEKLAAFPVNIRGVKTQAVKKDKHPFQRITCYNEGRNKNKPYRQVIKSPVIVFVEDL